MAIKNLSNNNEGLWLIIFGVLLSWIFRAYFAGALPMALEAVGYILLFMGLGKLIRKHIK